MNITEITDTPDKVKVPATTSKELPLNDPTGWNIMILNNPVTPFEVVIEALMSAVKISQSEAIKRMMAAHTKGWCVVATYGSKDTAETVAANIEKHAAGNDKYDHYRQLVKHNGPWPLDTEIMKAGE